MHYKFRITNWYGRMGNNIFQLSHALYLAMKTKSTLEFPNHNIIKQNFFDFSNGEEKLQSYNSDFWDTNILRNKFNDFSYDEFCNLRPSILRDYILPLLPHDDLDLNYDIVIHLRGGDIFTHPVHPLYVQSPFSYFKKILDVEKPNNAIIVCEDRKNPLIPLLLDSIPNCQINSNLLLEDINIILNCKKLIIGGETSFSHLLAQASKKIEKVYCPVFEGFGKESYIGSDICEIIFVHHENYIKSGEWKFDEKQKDLMFLHSTNDLRLELRKKIINF